MEDKIQEELNSNNLWAVKYGSLILIAVFLITFSSLFFLKIDGESLIYWLINNSIK